MAESGRRHRWRWKALTLEVPADRLWACVEAIFTELFADEDDRILDVVGRSRRDRTRSSGPRF
jgi:hypothetical protein